MSKTDKAGIAPLETVTLLKPHTHAGVDYKADDKIEVNEADKAWLVANEVIAAPAVN